MWRIQSIRADDNSVYTVTFGVGLDTVSFEMRVEGDEIPILTRDQNFYDHFQCGMGAFKLVFEAVFAFHEARSARIPANK